MKDFMTRKALKCAEACDNASLWMLRKWYQAKDFLQKSDPGVDGILVTVGLCIIALLLCVVMKTSLTSFIEKIVESMTDKAKLILNPSSAGL